MDRDLPTVHGSDLPPSSLQYSSFSPTGNGYNMNIESPALAPGASSEVSQFSLPDESNRFSHDISCMPDTPTKKLGHRRAHSEILTLPDDISFDSDLGVVGGADGPSFSDEADDALMSMFLDMEKFNSSSATSTGELSGSAMMMGQTSGMSGAATSSETAAGGSNERPRVRHQHSLSLDGSSTMPDMLMSGTEDTAHAETKKAMSAAKLAELALLDPKRAKRIWANRQSAARSKERKMRYIGELERNLQTLQTEATSLSAQLTLLQRDTSGLTIENNELKLRLQTTEQQVQLQDALNEALRDEIQRLKALTSQASNGGAMMNHASQPFYHGNHSTQHALLAQQQFQHLQIQSQQQQQQQQQQHQQHQQQQYQYQFQHQLQNHQVQEQNRMQQQSGGDFRVRGSMLSAIHNNNASDLMSPASKD